MPALISVQGINDAISALNVKENTLKDRFLKAIRSFLSSEEDIINTQSIPIEELIKKIWEIEDPKEIRAKRKNFSGLKSSVNTSLKKLDKKGKNPEGLVLNRKNVFEISAAKKDSLLKQMGITPDTDPEMIKQFSEFQKQFGGVAKERGWGNINDLLKELDENKQQVQDLSSQLAETQQIVSEISEKLISKEEELDEAISQIPEEGELEEGEAEELEEVE
ncbi:MAG: hypothetical protein KAK02_07950, partial [Desulfobulbaceae bacterium]|nr:hypothetical protein [Desulfobulbaceae bacterium]